MTRPLSLFSLVITLFSCHRVEIPYTQLGNWIQAAPINNYPRSGSVSFVIGDTAYVGLGFNETIPGTGKLQDFWAFNVNNGWTQLPDFPGPARSNAVGFGLNGFGYVGTGTDGVKGFNDFYQYDPVQKVWNRKADFTGSDRYDAVGFSVQGLGYIGTGYNNYWLNDFFQYDPQRDKWSPTPGTAGNFSKRRGAVAFVYDNKAFIATGSISGGMARDVWRFDPSQVIPWYRLSDIINDDVNTFDDGYTDIERQYGVAFVNGNTAYLTTGTNTSMVSSTWAYDITSDRWTPRTGWPRTQRYGAVGFTISGRSFLGTGNTGSNGTFDDFDEFLPLAVFNANDF